MTTPDQPTLLVHPDDLARRLGLAVPVEDGEAYWAISQAIYDTQCDVEAYLGRAIVPEQYTDHNCYPHAAGWRLKQYPLVSIVSVVAEDDGNGVLTGTFAVTYIAGLDGAALRPIVRYIAAVAAASPLVAPLIDPKRKRITSVSVEGQSVSFEANDKNLSAEQKMPQLKSLDRWRVAGRRVFQRPGIAPGPGYTRIIWHR